jgi:hypothetical protein
MRLDFCSLLPVPWCMWLNIIAAVCTVAGLVAVVILMTRPRA